MTMQRVVVDKCTSYEHNGLHINICYSKTKILVTIASKTFALHILPGVEALWITLGEQSREVYWDHTRGKVRIIDYTVDGDRLLEDDRGEVSTGDRKVGEILREFEEIANSLLDQAAVLIAVSDQEQ